VNQDRNVAPEAPYFAVPVRWFRMTLARVAPVDDAALDPAFGPGRSRKIKSWGHDAEGVHWLATRGGTPYHTDPNYARFTHHLLVRNDGWRIRGFSDERHPVMEPGALYCLDTHSPHEVVRDDRLPWGMRGYKLQVAVDRDEPLTPSEAWALLSPWIGRNPGETSATAQRMAPRFRKDEHAP
jgi:hypothetical protein